MRRTTAILCLLCAACSDPQRAGEPAPVALADSSVTVDDWHAVAVVDGHIHPHAGGEAAIEATTALVSSGLEILKTMEADRDTRDRLAQTVDCFCRTLTVMLRGMFGDPYGGRGRLTLGLRHYPEGENGADRGVFIELPALKPGETERTVSAADMIAAYHDPILEPKATVESGWVTVRQVGEDRAEFHVALIFRVTATGERLHLVTRTEAPLSRR